MRRRLLPCRTCWRDDGFTLVEILVALIVLTIGMLGLSRASLTTLETNTTNQRRIIAISLVQDRLESIKRAGYVSAVSAAYPDEQYGSIVYAGYSYAGYKRVTVITNNTPAPNMRTVTVTVSWEQDRHAVNATTILAQ